MIFLQTLDSFNSTRLYSLSASELSFFANEEQKGIHMMEIRHFKIGVVAIYLGNSLQITCHSLKFMCIAVVTSP